MCKARRCTDWNLSFCLSAGFLKSCGWIIVKSWVTDLPPTWNDHEDSKSSLLKIVGFVPCFFRPGTGAKLQSAWLYVCLSTRISQNLMTNFTKFTYMLLVAVDASSSDNSALRYVLLVLWITSYFTMEPVGQNQRWCCVLSIFHHVVASPSPGAK